MKVLVLNSTDANGGAAKAAYRLHQGLLSFGVQSQMLVQTKSTDHDSVIGMKETSGVGQILNGLRLTLDSLPLKVYPNRERTVFSTQWVSEKITSKIISINPDIVNLHWINSGYIRIETIARINKPLVWTLHDMWAFTGGCHYDQNCNRYMDFCGTCPQLGSTQDRDISRWILKRKAAAWKNLDLTIVALSQWMAKCVHASSLFRDTHIEIIPNGIDIQKYRPIPRHIAREILGLPLDKQLILCGSINATNDKRKGFHLLQPALKSLYQLGYQNNIELVIFGASRPSAPSDVGLNTHYLGLLSDDYSLCLAYSAADVFIAPSTQDNLPNTVMEALSCGVPCIAFDIGGMPDLIEHRQNGYLAQPYKINDLVEGIKWVLESEERYRELSYRSRRKAEEEFASEIQARRYQLLFDQALMNKSIYNKAPGVLF